MAWEHQRTPRNRWWARVGHDIMISKERERRVGCTCIGWSWVFVSMAGHDNDGMGMNWDEMARGTGTVWGVRGTHLFIKTFCLKLE